MVTHVLVTGGNGFLGSALCNELLAKDIRVTAMVRRPTFCLPKGVETWVAPELPQLAEDIVKRLADVDVVIHTAGRAHVAHEPAANSLMAFCDVNTKGTLALARAAIMAGVSRFIYVSSIGVNGSQSGDRAFCANDPPRPDLPYAQSKLEAEQALFRLGAKNGAGMIMLVVRPPMIYGRAAPGNFASLVKLVSRGWPLPFGALKAPRSFVAIENIVDLLVHMSVHPSPPEGVYLVADEQVTTTADFIRAISQGMGLDVTLIPVPIMLLKVLAGLIGRGEQMHKMCVPLVVNIKGTKDRLDWIPPFNMEQAMERAFAIVQESSTSQESAE